MSIWFFILYCITELSNLTLSCERASTFILLFIMLNTSMNKRKIKKIYFLHNLVIYNFANKIHIIIYISKKR